MNRVAKPLDLFIFGCNMGANTVETMETMDRMDWFSPVLWTQ